MAGDGDGASWTRALGPLCVVAQTQLRHRYWGAGDKYPETRGKEIGAAQKNLFCKKIGVAQKILFCKKIGNSKNENMESKNENMEGKKYVKSGKSN